MHLLLLFPFFSYLSKCIIYYEKICSAVSALVGWWLIMRAGSAAAAYCRQTVPLCVLQKIKNSLLPLISVMRTWLTQDAAASPLGSGENLTRFCRQTRADPQNKHRHKHSLQACKTFANTHTQEWKLKGAEINTHFNTSAYGCIVSINIQS